MGTYLVLDLTDPAQHRIVVEYSYRADRPRAASAARTLALARIAELRRADPRLRIELGLEDF